MLRMVLADFQPPADKLIVIHIQLPATFERLFGLLPAFETKTSCLSPGGVYLFNILTQRVKVTVQNCNLFYKERIP